MDRIYTEGLKFRDEKGRECIFNGINLVNKGEPTIVGHRKYKFKWDEETIREFKELGFNLIRLGVIWDAVEPKPGVYNEEYLDEIEKIVKYCEKYKIYFFIDIHQDLYGAKSGVGDGAPEWACLAKGEKFKKALFIWAEGYFYGRAVQKSFDAFWANEKVNGRGLQEYYCDMLKHVAERFSKSPAYFGFDLMNEPYPGTPGGKVFTSLIETVVKMAEERAGKIGKKFELRSCFDGGNEKKGFLKLIGKTAARLASPAKLSAIKEIMSQKELFHKAVLSGYDIIKDFDVNLYSPFINKGAAAIREVTDKGIILMENCYYSNLGIPYSAPAVEVNGVREKQLAFAPHGYDLFVDSPLYKYASNERVDSIFEEHQRSQQRLGVPVIVGEWGGFTGGNRWIGHIDHLIEFFNSNNWSSVYWAYDKKILKSPVIDSLSRPYPQRINGDLISFSYDKEDKYFRMSFVQNEDNDEDTIVFLHSRPKDIETDCQYEIESYPFAKTGILRLYGKKGGHKLKIIF